MENTEVKKEEEKNPVANDETNSPAPDPVSPDTGNISSEQKMMEEINAVKKVQEPITEIPKGNVVEQEILASEAQPPALGQPATEKKKFKASYTSKYVDEKGKTHYVYGDSKKKPEQKQAATPGQMTAQPPQPGQSTAQPVQQPPPEEKKHKQDILSKIIDGGIKPFIAWKTKTPYPVLLNTKDEQAVLKDVQPDNKFLQTKSWLAYFFVQATFTIQKIMFFKFNFLFNADGSLKENLEEEMEKHEQKKEEKKKGNNKDTAKKSS